MKQDVELRGPGGPCLRTGQVAEQAGVNVQTLRYYERRGLIAEPARSPGGHRSYPPETIALLTVIKAAQRSVSRWRRWPSCSTPAGVATPPPICGPAPKPRSSKWPRAALPGRADP